MFTPLKFFFPLKHISVACKYAKNVRYFIPLRQYPDDIFGKNRIFSAYRVPISRVTL